MKERLKERAKLLRKNSTRADYLESKGFQVLRFWNNQMLQETEAVLETIYVTLEG